MHVLCGLHRGVKQELVDYLKKKSISTCNEVTWTNKLKGKTFLCSLGVLKLLNGKQLRKTKIITLEVESYLNEKANETQDIKIAFFLNDVKPNL